jgi:hypothetical protein
MAGRVSRAAGLGEACGRVGEAGDGAGREESTAGDPGAELINGR